MCHDTHARYRCGCLNPCPPFCLDQQRTTITNQISGVRASVAKRCSSSIEDSRFAEGERGRDLKGSIEPKDFCCSPCCCSERVDAKRRVYEGMLEENEERVEKGECVGLAEMTRWAQRLVNAKQDFEEGRGRHEGCTGKRAEGWTAQKG